MQISRARRRCMQFTSKLNSTNSQRIQTALNQIKLSEISYTQLPTQKRLYLNIIIGNAIIQIGNVELSPCFDGRRSTTWIRRGHWLVRVHIVFPSCLRRLTKTNQNNETNYGTAPIYERKRNRNRKHNRIKANTLAAAYGAARLAARLGRRRAGPGPEARPRPLVLAREDFLLFLIISSRVISKAADMFACDSEARIGDWI